MNTHKNNAIVSIATQSEGIKLSLKMDNSLFARSRFSNESIFCLSVFDVIVRLGDDCGSGISHLVLGYMRLSSCRYTNVLKMSPRNLGNLF